MGKAAPHLDYFVTLRSPYSYLATARVTDLARRAGTTVRLRPVYPLAIRNPEFFRNSNPLLLSYLRLDAVRVAQMQDIPFAWPQPDPIVQDHDTSQIAQDQPHIYRLTRLTAAACTLGDGMAFYRAVSALIFDGHGDWTDQAAFGQAAADADLDLAKLEQSVAQDPDALDESLAENASALGDAGHWGTPTLIFDGALFFGQDRIAMCEWHMAKTLNIAKV